MLLMKESHIVYFGLISKNPLSQNSVASCCGADVFEV